MTDYLDATALGFACTGTRIHRLANVRPGVVLGDHCRIDAFATLTGGRLGRYVHIGTGAGCFGFIDLDDYSALSPGVQAFAATEDIARGMTNPCLPPSVRFPIHAAVRIGRHALVGANSVLLPGATLGEGCVVGALSLVKGALAAWTVCAGTPARALRPRPRDATKYEHLLSAPEARA